MHPSFCKGASAPITLSSSVIRRLHYTKITNNNQSKTEIRAIQLNSAVNRLSEISTDKWQVNTNSWINESNGRWWLLIKKNSERTSFYKIKGIRHRLKWSTDINQNGYQVLSCLNIIDFKVVWWRNDATNHSSNDHLASIERPT